MLVRVSDLQNVKMFKVFFKGQPNHTVGWKKHLTNLQSFCYIPGCFLGFLPSAVFLESDVLPRLLHGGLVLKVASGKGPSCLGQAPQKMMIGS